MNLLALDTSSNACSVALQTNETIEVSHVVKPREHTAILIPMIEAVLRAAHMELTDLDCIVLGNGPGSFIGMRIAASVAQGMAFGAGLKIVPVSSLAAIAAEAFATHEDSRALIAQDARMNEVYLESFVRDEEGLPVAEGKVRLHKVTASLDSLIDERSLLVAGAGWQRYPELLEGHARVRQGLVDICYPNARYLLELGLRGWHADGAISPHEVVPEYVRMRVAVKPEPTKI